MIETKNPELGSVHVLIGKQNYKICVLYPRPGEVKGEGFIKEEISERTANRPKTRKRILGRLQSLGLKPQGFAYLPGNHQLSFGVIRLDQPKLPL